MLRRVIGCCFILLQASNGFLNAQTRTPPSPVEFGLVTYLSLRHQGTELGSSIKPTEVDRTNYLDAFRESGVKTIRDAVVNWAEIQPERRGKSDFAHIDDLITKASDRGIEVLALFYFLPPWATVNEDRPWTYPAPPDGRYNLPRREHEAEFKHFIRDWTDRYCGCRANSLPLKKPVRHYVFMNEPENYGSEPLEANEYAHWLRLFYQEVKSVDPNAKIVAPALAAPGVWSKQGFRGKFLEDLLSAKELQGPGFPYFDILDFHPYPSAYGRPNPDIYGINIADQFVRGALRAHKLDLPLWITEIGDSSPDDRVQADRLIQYVIHAASVGVQRVYVFGQGDYGTSHWGLLKDTPSGEVPARKPSFIAYQTLLKKIGDNQGVEFLGPGRYRVLRPVSGPVYVLWAAGAFSQAPGVLRGPLRVTSLDNHSQDIDAAHLVLSEHPVLVEPVN